MATKTKANATKDRRHYKSIQGVIIYRTKRDEVRESVRCV